jgi:hypothetical protein
MCHHVWRNNFGIESGGKLNGFDSPRYQNGVFESGEETQI